VAIEAKIGGEYTVTGTDGHVETYRCLSLLRRDIEDATLDILGIEAQRDFISSYRSAQKSDFFGVEA